MKEKKSDDYNPGVRPLPLTSSSEGASHGTENY